MRTALVLGRDGIEEEGSHDELLAKQGVYYRLWNGLVSGKRCNAKGFSLGRSCPRSGLMRSVCRTFPFTGYLKPPHPTSDGGLGTFP